MARTYDCLDCGKSFRTKFQLRLHRYQHSGEKPFKCDACDNAFVTRSKLKKHEKRHDGYRCRSECPFVAYKWSELQKHVAAEHKPTCPVCQKKFSSNYNLKSHQKTHLDKNNREKFLCSFAGCSRSYSKQSNLKIHMQAVHEDVKFICPIETCQKRLRHKVSLNKHISWHYKPKAEPKQVVVKRKTVVAEKITGAEVPGDVADEILQKDVEFRKFS